MTLFHDVGCGKDYILHGDLCYLIDAGIDYNLLNEICGFVLQKREVRNPPAKKSTTETKKQP